MPRMQPGMFPGEAWWSVANRIECGLPHASAAQSTPVLSRDPHELKLAERNFLAMDTQSIPSHRIKLDTSVVPLTTVQRALWQLGAPILDAGAVAKYKNGAKLGMLWRTVRWLLLAMAAPVAFMCIGHQWGRVASVGADAVLLATLFGWLVNASDLKWLTMDYSAYRNQNPVPPHVSAAANALLDCGVPQERIGVEYLKTDPILFVEDAEQGAGVKRYDLVIW